MPNVDNHIRRGHPVVFGLLVGFGLIEIAISGWLTGVYNRHHNYLNTSVRDRTHYILFVSAWTVLFGLFYLALFLHSAANGSVATSVLSHGVFLFITWVLWVAAAASITAALGGGLDCNLNYTYCGQLNALEAFAWIEWILITLALIVVIFRGVAATRRGDGLRGQLVA
ncbi:hypothetical protein POSPLADRAFT_1072209 [Postia placenta MAD-698-R-SB12]|uniref:MARVEL domain-containing protein n=1 Tax=Postia placenta MAD-698-R-SB12 TaxID=670580 RepID=A0A1X6NEV9_9APHY|nr:hypothetical protein POSPLADRAFT_1072209 [Postia placenta MAD-698-R-SB12]OSX67161.1 hypothetical protein POSPLADRAFT_1072209 [Postia placenta MAD-698-R-SB12]